MSGWPTLYIGISLLSTGVWIGSGLDMGLIVAGIGVTVAGIIQVSQNWW